MDLQRLNNKGYELCETYELPRPLRSTDAIEGKVHRLWIANGEDMVIVFEDGTAQMITILTDKDLMGRVSQWLGWVTPDIHQWNWLRYLSLLSTSSPPTKYHDASKAFKEMEKLITQVKRGTLDGK